MALSFACFITGELMIGAVGIPRVDSISVQRPVTAGAQTLQYRNRMITASAFSSISAYSGGGVIIGLSSVICCAADSAFACV